MPVASLALVAADPFTQAHPPRAVEELTTTLPIPAPRAYELFAAAERAPEWMSVISAARVLSRDAAGRAAHVTYLARLERGTIGYSIHYRYDEAALWVGWSTPAGGALRVAGAASFRSLTMASSMMVYTLSLAMPALGPWEDPQFEAHPASAVLSEFRDFVRRF